MDYGSCDLLSFFDLLIFTTTVKGHRRSLEDKTARKATHAYGPAGNTAFTPVIEATGAARADGLKALKMADLFEMKKKYDELDVPMEGRIALLSAQHVQDICAENINIFNQFANLATGTVLTIAGFDIYQSNLNPTYNKTTKVKKAFGAVAAPSTDTVSSLFYHSDEVMVARGTIDMFSRLADPEARGDIMGFQMFFIGLPIRSKHIGAILSV